jgi:serine/threonine protein kinase
MIADRGKFGLMPSAPTGCGSKNRTPTDFADAGIVPPTTSGCWSPTTEHPGYEREVTRSPLLGRVLAGRYRLESEIGSGGMGAVYRAVDELSGVVVALKVLKAGSDDPELVARFRREQTFVTVQSPHLVRVLDHGDDDGLLFLVLEYLQGHTLRDRLAQGEALAVQEALTIARDVARALHALHEGGIAHRDIKPANIMLVQEPSPRAVLLDFGIARSLDPGATMTTASFVVGTAGYIAPEISLGGRAYESRADLYSLGVVLYEMLVGAPPFVAANALALAARQASEDPHPPRVREPSVPVDVDRLVMRLLARNPARRPAEARQVVMVLDAFLAGTTPEGLSGDVVDGLIDANPYYTITWDKTAQVVCFTRTETPFAHSEDVGWGYSVAREAFSLAERQDQSLLMDLRRAPLRAEPRFTKIVIAEMPGLYAGWKKVATLVRSQEGLAQVDQLRSRAGVVGRSFVDESAALAWLMSED